MAKHYNNIRIARGIKSAFKDSATYGELFYDKNTHGVYIGTEENDTELRRFGGFDSINIKGTITNTVFKSVAATAEPGDAYVVVSPITAESYDFLYDGSGSVVISEDNKYKSNDFYKPGQVVIFVGNSSINGTDYTLTNDTLKKIPNAYVLSTNGVTEDDNGNSNGVLGAIVLSGTADANDLEYDPSQTDIAADEDIRDVQRAFDYLFNHKIQYMGTFNRITISGDDNETTYNSEDSARQAFWELIADAESLKKGQMIVYNGYTKKIPVTINDEETSVLLRTNTLIINDDGLIKTIPLGVSDAGNSDFSWSGNRNNAGNDIHQFETFDRYGTKQSGQSDTDVSTVLNALDDLHQTKADLTSTGKIPLSQIPSTMIGALQYIGTLTIADDDNWADTLTAVQFATLMGAVKGGWEKDDEGGTDSDEILSSAKSAYNTLDEGDYVIVSISKSTTNDTEKALTTEINVTDSSGNTLFKVSNGDHVIINSITQSDKDITSVELDHLNSSAAVDAINGMQGSIWIEDSIKSYTNKDGTNADGADVIVTTDAANFNIKLNTPNAVYEKDVINATYIPQATGETRTIIQSEIKITDSDTDNKTNTKLTANKVVTDSDGNNVTSEVSIEFPDEDGKISVVPTNGGGNTDILAKFDTNGNIIDSEISQTTDSGNGSLNLGVKDGSDPTTASISVNYDQKNSLIQYKVDGEVNTYRFDDNELSSHDNREKTATNIYTILDIDSTIDGGEWTN